MNEFLYDYADADGKIITRNLHRDGAVSCHPAYLAWSQDDILDKIRRRESVIIAQWDRADKAQRNHWLRHRASLWALFDYNKRRENARKTAQRWHNHVVEKYA